MQQLKHCGNKVFGDKALRWRARGTTAVTGSVLSKDAVATTPPRPRPYHCADDDNRSFVTDGKLFLGNLSPPSCLPQGPSSPAAPYQQRHVGAGGGGGRGLTRPPSPTSRCRHWGFSLSSRGRALANYPSFILDQDPSEGLRVRVHWKSLRLAFHYLERVT